MKYLEKVREVERYFKGYSVQPFQEMTTTKQIN
jgi:hypothetical protein